MKKTKRIYYSLVIITFLALYLVSMFSVTYFVEEKFVEEYESYLYNLGENLRQHFLDDNSHVLETTKLTKSQRELAYFNYMISINNTGMDKYQMVSMALYDEEGKLIVQTGDMIGNSRNMYPCEEFFTQAEIEELIQLYPKSEKETDLITDNGNSYLSLFYLDGYKDPMGIEVRHFGSGDVLWSWTNVMTDQNGYADYDEEQTGYLFFPYLKYGEKAWQDWHEDEWLQGFSEIAEEEKIALKDYNDYYAENGGVSASGGRQQYDGNKARIVFSFAWQNEIYSEYDSVSKKEVSSYYQLELRHKISPWMAAMDYMKYIYVAGAILVLCSMSIVLYAMKRTSEKQAELEKSRRDFTNAAAHELKTPLGIIRGFAENVKENTVEDKRDYYLEQIISQTEIMDDLVKEMIGISKMDSEEFPEEKVPVSIHAIVQEQVEKLRFPMEEKNLQLEMNMNADFCVDGDAAKLNKAFWNLLDNAIEHNHENGTITIHLDFGICVIENTGNPIAEEDLPHICDMFYTGDKSRSDSKRHKGLGLYLAKRILEMNGLEMRIGNCENGVIVTVRNKKITDAR